MNLTFVDVPCPTCGGQPALVDPYDCRYTCLGGGTVKGYSEEQKQTLLDAVANGAVLQYDDYRNCRWEDIAPSMSKYFLDNSKSTLRIKPDPLDDNQLTCDITVGGTVVAKGSKMRQLQDAINAALSK